MPLSFHESLSKLIYSLDPLKNEWIEEQLMPAPLPPVRGIEIYRRNLFAALQDQLTLAYPKIKELLEDNFKFFSREYILAFPSQHWDIGKYGHEFSAFLHRRPELVDLPWLSDLAKFEWSVFRLKQKTDPQSMTQESAENILREWYAQDHTPQFHLELSSKADLLLLSYPVHSDLSQLINHDRLQEQSFKQSYLLLYRAQGEIRWLELFKDQYQLLELFLTQSWSNDRIMITITQAKKFKDAEHVLATGLILGWLSPTKSEFD